jgi:hypothetical protein
MCLPRRASRPAAGPEITELFVLDEWNHPNVAVNERPSGLTTFADREAEAQRDESPHFA